MRRVRRASVGIAAVLSLGGCASHRPPLATPPPDGGASLDRTIASCRREVLFDGELRIRGRYRGRRLRGRAVAVAMSSGRLYVESVGDPAFVLASDGEEVRAFLVSERVWVLAPASARTVEGLVGLPIEPAWLAALLGGCGAPAGALAASSPDGASGLRLAAGLIELDPVLGRVRAGETRGLVFRYREDGRRLALEVPARELELDLELRDEPRGSAPSVSLFRPEPPPELVRVDLELQPKPFLLGGSEP